MASLWKKHDCYRASEMTLDSWISHSGLCSFTTSSERSQIASISAPRLNPECLFLQELHLTFSAGLQDLIWASEETGWVFKS